MKKTLAIITALLLCVSVLFTINGDWFAVSFEGYEYLNATLNVNGGTINAKGNSANFNFVNEYASVVITGGTLSCDPTVYVDTANYNVTDNGNGTWTVTAK